MGNEHSAESRADGDLALQEIRVATVKGGEAGVLVLKSDQLVAVLTRVDEEEYSTDGQWFLETGFGRLSGCHRIFRSIEEATAWIGGRLPVVEPC
ncbi:hypothetical protein [Mesorhizobium xinjiangense]|uniref:hypothetical protein n=1 Tax=Mesorhizobium xinjiangense TaxID=2678685 RepID=UPI0012EED892|nr:hypothetical protein [Mesorhizobium xinjiangense]